MDAAETRARELLRSVVSPDEFELYERLGFLSVAGRNPDYAWLVYPYRPLVAYDTATGELLTEYCVRFCRRGRAPASRRRRRARPSGWRCARDERELIAECEHAPARLASSTPSRCGATSGRIRELHGRRARLSLQMSDATETKTALPRPRSAAVFDGPERAAARAYMKGIGFDDDALSRPTIGIANTWIEAMPCNFHLRGLAEHIKDGVRAAGGTPMEFNTIAISDGITMGTQGMKTSLVSPRGDRRLDRAHRPRLPVRRRGRALRLRQDDSRRVMALARLDIPSRDALRRLDRARPLAGQGRDDPRRLRGDRRPRGRGDDRRGAAASSRTCASPGAGACGGQFTANTMACAFEALGISPGGSAMVPAEDDDKATVAEQIGELVMQVLAEDLRPSQVITRDSLENAIACVCASGGSTNGVLHLLAVAREAGIELEIDDFERISRRTPLLADLKPGGRFVATDLYAAGGVPLVLQRLQEAGLLHGDALTVSGRTIGEEAAAATETPGQEVVRPRRRPAEARGRARDPARQPRARGRRGQARRHRAHRPDRPGPRVRVRGGVLRTRSRASRSRPATSS